MKCRQSGTGWGKVRTPREVNYNSSSQTKCRESAECHKIDNIRPCREIQGWIFPSGPASAASRQQMWDPLTSARHGTNYILLRSTPSGPHQQNQFWEDSTRCFVTNGQSGKWTDANLLMRLFCFFSPQRRVWTGCGERLPSAPGYLPRWDGNIYLFHWFA